MKTFMLSIILMSFSGFAAAEDQYIRIDTPSESDSIDPTKPIPVSGSGKGLFEGLENIYWQLRQYLSETGEMTPVLPKTTVNARFSDGQISGSAGCNRYFGPYSTGQDNHLTLASEIGSTQMACPPAISRQEQRYFALLPLVNTWQRHDESLLLLDKYRQPLLKYAAAKPTGLEGSPWQATGINNGRGGVVSGKTTHLTTALFGNDTISGNAGCNDFTAAYEIKGKQITIGRAATTRKHCVEPDGIMEQEQQYLHALARARTYALKPDRLELRDENGALQVSYRVQKN